LKNFSGLAFFYTGFHNQTHRPSFCQKSSGLSKNGYIGLSTKRRTLPPPGGRPPRAAVTSLGLGLLNGALATYPVTAFAGWPCIANFDAKCSFLWKDLDGVVVCAAKRYHKDRQRKTGYQVTQKWRRRCEPAGHQGRQGSFRTGCVFFRSG
jgi:hypothetical protein